MQTNEGRCRWCGKDLYWIWKDGRKVAIEQGYTPYKVVERPQNTLYTQLGRPIPCEILPRIREEEADGFAHIVHICQKKPVYHRPRPMTRRQRENL